MTFLKLKILLSFPLKPLRKPSLLLRLAKRPFHEFLRHRASDSENYYLKNTDATRLNNRKNVCCAWLNRSKKLTARDSRCKNSVSSKKKTEREKNTRLCLLNCRKILGGKAEATMTELELTEDVLEARRSLRETLSELSAHSQNVNFVRWTY